MQAKPANSEFTYAPPARAPWNKNKGRSNVSPVPKPPVREGIPDFIREELSQSRDPVLRRMTAIDRMAGIYETKLWYPLVLNVYGGFGAPSLKRRHHSHPEDRLQGKPGARCCLRPGHFWAAYCVTVEGGIRNRCIREDASARPSLYGKGRHPERAFCTCESGGASVRSRLF